MEIKGRIIQVMPLVSGEGRNGTWKKQEYILEIPNDKFAPKKLCFSVWTDKIDQFAIKEGEELTVSVDLESREFNGRWYTDVRAWKVSRGQQENNSGQPTRTEQPSNTTTSKPETPVSAPEIDDDLPF